MKAPRFRIAVVVLVLAFASGIHAGAQGLIDSVDDLTDAFEIGGEYRIVPNTYVMEEPLEVRVDVTLIGSDRERVSIEARGAPVAVRVVGDVDVHLEGLRLIYAGDAGSDLIVLRDARLTMRGVDLGFAKAGAASDPPDADRPGGHGSSLVLLGDARVAASDLRIAQSEVAAVEANGTSVIVLVDSQLIGNFRGLLVGGEARLELRGTTVSGQYAQGLVIGDHAQALLVDTGFIDNGVVNAERGQFFEAVRVFGQARVDVEGGTFRDAPSVGLSVGGNAEVVLNGTLLEGNGGVYADIDRTWGAVLLQDDARMAIHGGSARANPGGAFEVNDMAGLALQDVLVEGNGSWGHTVVMDGALLSVRGGTFIDNAGALFVGDDGRAGIEGAELRGGGDLGIVAGVRASIEVTDTSIVDHGGRGVWIDGGASAELTNLTITGNEVGLWMTGSTTAFLRDSAILDHRHTGVALLGTARLVLEGNEVAGNTVNGVALTEGSSAVLSDNQLTANGDTGLLVQGTAMASLERNTIGGSPSGVRLEGEGQAQQTATTFADNVDDVVEDR